MCWGLWLGTGVGSGGCCCSGKRLTPPPTPLPSWERGVRLKQVDVVAVVDGWVVDVRCSICGRVRTWVP